MRKGRIRTYEKKMVGEGDRAEMAVTEVCQAESRPAEIFQIGTESSSHDLGEEMGLDCRSGVNE